MRSPFLRLGVFAALLALGACRPSRPYVWLHELPLDSQSADRPIEPRDTVLLHVRDQPTLSGELVVRDDGQILQPLIGNIKVAGMTSGEASRQITERLRAMVVEPQVSLAVSRPAPVRVSVIGEVRNPGVYELARDRGVLAALAAAGWLTDYASKDGVYVVRAGDTGPRVRVRVPDLTSPEPRAASFRLRDGDAVVVE